MRTITFRAVFIKDGKYVYDAVMFGGTVGIYTGIKKGVFSVSENQREPGKHRIGLLDNLYMQAVGYKEISWIIRDTLMTCDSYDCAKNALTSTPINALGYITIAGTKPNEGAIISRNRYDAAHIEYLSNSTG